MIVPPYLGGRKFTSQLLQSKPARTDIHPTQSDFIVRNLAFVDWLMTSIAPTIPSCNHQIIHFPSEPQQSEKTRDRKWMGFADRLPNARHGKPHTCLVVVNPRKRVLRTSAPQRIRCAALGSEARLDLEMLHFGVQDRRRASVASEFRTHFVDLSAACVVNDSHDVTLIS